jgi:hypothetical protein
MQMPLSSVAPPPTRRASVGACSRVVSAGASASRPTPTRHASEGASGNVSRTRRRPSLARRASVGRPMRTSSDCRSASARGSSVVRSGSISSLASITTALRNEPIFHDVSQYAQEYCDDLQSGSRVALAGTTASSPTLARRASEGLSGTGKRTRRRAFLGRPVGMGETRNKAPSSGSTRPRETQRSANPGRVESCPQSKDRPHSLSTKRTQTIDIIHNSNWAYGNRHSKPPTVLGRS